MKKCALAFFFFSSSLFFFEAERCVLPSFKKNAKTLNKQKIDVFCVSDVRKNKQSHDDDALLSFSGDDDFRASGLFSLDQ